MNTAVGVATPGRGAAPSAARWRRERFFFSGLSLTLAVATFVGFAPTYYLKSAYGAPDLPLLVHIHGAVFTTWILLLLTQTTLVAARRTDLHRRLGVAGVVLAAVMTVLGLMTAIGSVRRGINSLTFLVVPVATVVIFPILVAAAVIVRRRPDAHKRLMMIATAEIITAATGRFSILVPWGPAGYFGAADLVVAALVVYDLVTRGRVHAATMWGGLFFVVSQPLRLMLGETEAWRVFAVWLTS